MKKLLRLCAAVLLLQASLVRAQYVDPSLRWRTMDTAHFSVHFAEAQRTQAWMAAGVAESVYPKITGWLDWQPQSRTHMVLLDSADFSNGFTSVLPFNYTAIFLSPPDDGELLQNRAWLEMVITHEFTHVVHLDKARGTPLVLRKIFGRLPLSILPPFTPFPNIWEPGWVTEGLAVYSESEASKGYGRLEQSFFEGMMRAEVGRGPMTLREINADGRGFPLNRDYLYGSYFFRFLAERYGAGAVIGYVENYSDNWFPFRLHSNTVEITGKPMDETWVDYHEWLKLRFAAKPLEAGAAVQANAQASVPANAKTTVKVDEGGDIIARSWSLASPALARDGTLWYVQSDGYTRPELIRRTLGGETKSVKKVERETRLATTARGEVLFAQIDICRNYNYYYDLYRVDRNGDGDRLTNCGRYRMVAPFDDGRIAALRMNRGDSEVVLLGAAGEVLSVLYRAAPGEALNGVAVSKDGNVAVTSLHNDHWSLIEIAGGKATVLVSDKAVKHSPRYGDSSDEIFFVADYGRIYNLWSWKRGESQVSRWTQAANGVKEISAPVSGKILLTTIEADGDVLRLHRFPASAIERRDPAAEQPAVETPPQEIAPLTGEDRAYWPLSSMLPRSWWPSLVYDSYGMQALGVQTFGQDALGLHSYAIAPMYEFTQNEFLGSAAYYYDDRHGLLFNRAMTVKATVPVDPNNSSSGKKIGAYTIDESVQWISTWRHLSLNSRYYWGLGAALDRSRFHQTDLQTTLPKDERVAGLVAGYDSRRWQWLSEGPSQGQQLRLFAETSNGLNGFYTGNVYRGDWRVHLPLDKTVISLRWNEVYAQPTAEAIQLGGSFSEETFTLPVLDQREFPLRGYTSGEAGLTGHRARLGTFEWRIPLSDIDRHFMLPPVGMNRLSMTVFVDAGAAWDPGTLHRAHRGVGVELLSEFRFGYLMGLQARFGVARGIDEFGRTVGYVRVGRSF